MWCVLVFMVMRLAAANDPTTCSTPDGGCSATGSSILQVDHHALSTDVEGDSELMEDDEGDDEEQRDLLAIAGASNDEVSISASAMAGWQKGITVLDTSDGRHTSNGKDHALTWRKGSHCVASFSATNDAVDFEQVVGGCAEPPVSMCGFKMHAGVAQEMMQFKNNKKWADFIAYLNDGSCKRVTAVGHSLGGGMATALAACANAGIEGFGDRRDFRLVTYGAIAITYEPTYSGTKNTPFKGTRYNVEDSGQKGGIPSNTKQYRMDLLEFFAKVLVAMGKNPSQLMKARVGVEKYGNAEQVWKQVAAGLAPLHLYVMSLAQTGNADQRHMIGKFVWELQDKDILSFEHDFVPTLLLPFGFKHALVNYQPLVHPAKAPSATPMAMVKAKDAVEKPSGDLSQSVFTFLADRANFPNHKPCCYFKGGDCISYFEETQSTLLCSKSHFR